MKRLKYWCIVACVLLIISGGVYILGVYLNQQLDLVFSSMTQTVVLESLNVEVTEEMMKQESETKWINVALFGIDSQDEHQSRSDAMKVVSLNLEQNKMKITSFQRDMLVYIPGNINDFSKLNHAYQYGGATLALKTLNQNFDLDLTRYVTFNFNALEVIVDAIGGIEIEIKDFEVDYSKVLTESGIQTLNGEQALGYARMRQPDNDYERMNRQLNVMKAIFSKLKSLSLSELYALLEQCLSYVETNLTKEELINWGLHGLQLDLNEIEQYQLPENRSEDINQQVSYKETNGLNILNSYEQTVQSLHQFIYETPKYNVSETIKEIEQEIYNNFGYIQK